MKTTDSRLLAGLGYCVAAVLCVIFSFRYFIFSGFDRLAGDDGDSKLIMAQLEHWRGVLTGRVWYDSPIWFYPVKHILGIQDGLLLNGLTHAAARLFLDEHASLETGAMLTSLIGFAGMALVLRKGLGLRTWISIAGAALYAIEGILYRAHNAPQMLTVFYIPLLGFLLLTALIPSQTRFRSLALPAAALLFVSTWWSTFYVAWYATLFLMILVILGVITAAYRAGGSAITRWLAAVMLEQRREIAIASVLTLVGAIAFISLYLPHLKRHGGWAYDMAEGRLLHLSDLVTAGPGSWIWGFPFSQNWEAYGFPPLFSALCVTGIIWGVVRVLQRSKQLRVTEFYCGVVGVAALLLWFCFVKIGDWTIFEYLYRYLPGASAMRVPVRVNFFLAAIFVPIVMIVFAQVWSWSSRNLIARVLVIGALCLVFLEQGTSANITFWSRNQDRDLLADIPPPPPFCRSFFVNWTLPRPWDSPLLQYFYAPVSDAMLLASRWRLPTLNGLGTAAADEWPAPPPMYEPYEESIRRWVYIHKLRRVCRLILPTKTWQLYAGAGNPL